MLCRDSGSCWVVNISNPPQTQCHVGKQVGGEEQRFNLIYNKHQVIQGFRGNICSVGRVVIEHLAQLWAPRGLIEAQGRSLTWRSLRLTEEAQREAGNAETWLTCVSPPPLIWHLAPRYHQLCPLTTTTPCFLLATVLIRYHPVLH